MKQLITFLLISCIMGPFAFAQESIKKQNVAGAFYPADRADLSKIVDSFLSSASKPKGMEEVGIIITPHAGYEYSGLVAGYSFKAAAGRDVKTVIILAPSHYFSFRGASIWVDGAFRTPLGDVLVDPVLAREILAADPKHFYSDKSVYEKEHSIETQLPFIQKVFPHAQIVPIIVGQPDAEVVKALAKALSDAVGERDDVLIDVSSDQSHFHSEADAHTIDKRGLDAIEAMDIEKFWNGHVKGEMEVDAFHAITAAMLYAKEKGWTRVKVLKYATSADTTGDKSRVVGYAAVAFEKDNTPKKEAAAPLTEAQKKRLLEIARQTLEAFVKTHKVPDFDEKDQRLLEEEGAFVTLHKQGSLRGCIGNILGQGPLFKTVRDMTVAAASEDPRFDPVEPEELKNIDVEISVLSKPRVIQSVDEIVMGKHGVIVRKGTKSGVFLPQVATETDWSKERFLSELCSQKAGLSPDAWKDASTILQTFTAQVFGEK